MSLALVTGLGFGLALGHRVSLGSRLLPRFVSIAPSVSAPPPGAKQASGDGLVTAYAQIGGRSYHIVVGRQGGTRDGDDLWSAAFSTGEQRSDDASSP